MSSPADAPTPQAWSPPESPVSPGTPGAGDTVSPPAYARPSAVLRACLLTWIFSGLTAIGLVLTAVVLALDPDVLLDDAHRRQPDLAEQGVSDDMLLGVAFAMIGLAILWCVAAAVLAVLVLRRIDWARIVLIVSAGIAAAVSLAGLVVGGFLLVLTLAAAIGTAVLLVRSDTAAWFHQPR